MKTFKSLVSLTDGKKTYLAAAGLALFALLGLALGQHSPDEAFKLLLEAASIASLRHAVSK